MDDLLNVINVTKKIRLLYVEDNEFAREATLVVLEEFFDNVIVGVDGQDGLHKFNDNKIDLIITDINMPHLSGLDMIEMIREKDHEVPVLLLSAYTDVEYFTRSIKLGVDGYLLKPINIEQFLDVMRKVLEKIQLQYKLKENLNFVKQYQDATDESAIVSRTDVNGIITHVNSMFCEISEYTEAELLGQNQSIIRHPDTDKAIFEELWDTIQNKKQPWSGILRNMSKSGKTYYVDALIRPILDFEGNIVEYIGIRHNITEVMSAKKQLVDFVKAATNPFVVDIRIDDFEDIEKYYGEELTQKIEDTLCEKLVQHMPKELGFDSFYSLGNGVYTFAQDLEDVSLAVSIANELRVYQEEINNLDINIEDVLYDVFILVSISCNGNVLENVKYGLEELIDSNQSFIIANHLATKVHKEAQENLVILKKIKTAIYNEKIVSYFQPIVNADAQICKYESLVRLIDADDSVLAPHFFLDIAKKAKYYTSITSIVLKNSFEALQRTDKKISINLSAIDIEKKRIRDEVYRLLELHKENASRVVFELLEDEDVKDFQTITTFISKVKSYGVKIAIDDFGSGYSNYERLLDYQPDIIKLDGSIVKNIETSAFSMSIVNSVIGFAKEFDIEIIAEYVENENIYKILKDLGIEYFQGYYFSKPEILP